MEDRGDSDDDDGDSGDDDDDDGDDVREKENDDDIDDDDADGDDHGLLPGHDQVRGHVNVDIGGAVLKMQMLL